MHLHLLLLLLLLLLHLRANQFLTSNGVELNKEHWMKDAIDAEKGGSILTCQYLVRSTNFGLSFFINAFLHY